MRAGFLRGVAGLLLLEPVNVREKDGMKSVLLSILLSVIPVIAVSQHISSPRAIAFGAHTAVAEDISALDWNPAGLIFIKDWEIRINSYLEAVGSASLGGPFFSDGSIGKKIREVHSFGFRYAPGMIRQFSLTSDLLGRSYADYTPEFLRRRLEYKQVYSVGYANLITPKLSVGVGARLLEQQIIDPQFTTGDTISVSSQTFSAPLWGFDTGILYMLNPRVSLGLVAKNMVVIREDTFPEEFSDLEFSPVKYVRAGAYYKPGERYGLALDIDTRKRIQFGYEWLPSGYLRFRQGMYTNTGAAKPFEALSVGIGVRTGSMDLELSYLYFPDQTTRRQWSSVRTLKDDPIGDVGYNQFTGNRLDLSVRLQLGKVREQLARLEYVEIIGDVYPSSHHIYAYRPVAKARVRNISQRPIETRVGFYVKNLMDQATESRPHYLLPGEETEIPLLALFNDAIRSIASFTIQTAEVYVRATAAPEYDDRRQTALIVHGRNDWNGDILTLRYFVTPEDPQIIQFSRQVLHDYREELHTVPPDLERFHSVRMLFDRFSSVLLYVNDPRKTHNRVQYPAETLDLRGGDCDDMAVAFASMLASIGVAAAFVDIIPPSREHNAHVYLLFDTGLTPDQAHLVSTNPKRYIVRRNEFGIETVWIPLETTATREGFEEAWDVGAESYTNEVLLQGGLINGWVRIVDIPRL
jgi:hypothetical protein